MKTRVSMHHIFSGKKYYSLVKRADPVAGLKKSAAKDIKYLSGLNRYTGEDWHAAYMELLYRIFCVNLFARKYERILKRSLCKINDCDPFAPATWLALRTYNEHRKLINAEINSETTAEELAAKAAASVRLTGMDIASAEKLSSLPMSATPIGIELEFSDTGTKAGNFFEEGVPPFRNFSKYHHYNLLKYLWRFGAYIDSNIRIKQLIKKGGFLEYTFIRKQGAVTSPLTMSPALAAGLIKEATAFTPVRPHSLHLSLETGKAHTRDMTQDELFTMMLLSGSFARREGGFVETRIMDGDIKGTAVLRNRLNRSGLKMTVEFAHMRLSKYAAAGNLYEPLIMMFIGLKNTLSFAEVDKFSNRLYFWAQKPYAPPDKNRFMETVASGLKAEQTLTAPYREKQLSALSDLYERRKKLLSDC